MSGKVLHLPLHEWSGQANDLSGNDNHGTVNGATQGVAGKGGLTAYSFDGSSNVSAPLSSQSQFTISCWVKLDDLTEHAIHSKINSNFDSGWVLFYNSSQSHFVFQPIDGGGSTLLGATPPNGTVEANTWYNLTVVIDSGTNVEFWIDGEVQESASFGTYAQNTNNFRIAEDNSATYQNLTGNVCGVRTYNRVLSDSEIQTLYEWGNGDYVTPKEDGVSRYALDGNANDVWGSNDGTVNGASVSGDAIRGDAYSFDGTDDGITVTNDPSLEPSQITVSAWIKAGTLSTFQRVLHKGNGNVGWGISTDDSASELTAHYDDGTERIQKWSTSFQSGVWYHVAFTWDGSSLDVYVNGVKDNGSGATGNWGESTDELRIGERAGGDSGYWHGNIDEVRIYDYALEPHEVADLYLWGTRGRRMAQKLVNQ